MIHDIITRDTNSVSWAESWEFKVVAWHYRRRHHHKDLTQFATFIILQPNFNFQFYNHPVVYDYDIRIYWRDNALTNCSWNQRILNINIEVNFEANLWRCRWRHHHENYFFWHNLGRSCHIRYQIEAVFNILTFSKWVPFWGRNEHCEPWYRKLNIPAR